MKICQKCGCQNKDYAIYCARCGFKMENLADREIIKEEDEAYGTEKWQLEQSPPKSPKHKKWRWIVGLSAVILCFCAVIAAAKMLGIIPAFQKTDAGLTEERFNTESADGSTSYEEALRRRNIWLEDETEANSETASAASFEAVPAAPAASASENTTPSADLPAQSEAADLYNRYRAAADAVTAQGQWSENLCAQIDIEAANGGESEKITMYMDSSMNVLNYSPDDLSQIYMCGLGSTGCADEEYMWTVIYQNYVAHYIYLEPVSQSADIEMQPNYFDFYCISEDMIRSPHIEGNILRFVIYGGDMTRLGLAALKQIDLTELGIDSLLYSDIAVEAVIDTETGKLTIIQMTFDASIAIDDVQAAAKYSVSYEFGEVRDDLTQLVEDVAAQYETESPSENTTQSAAETQPESTVSPSTDTDGMVYLENCPITVSDSYQGNEGDSFIYTIGQHKWSRGNRDINGKEYPHGLEAWIARWNYTDEVSWAYATYELDSQYSELSGYVVLIDSYNTYNFDSTLYFYNGDNLLAQYTLLPDQIPFDVEVNVTGVDQLTVYISDNKAVSGGTSFGLIDMILTGGTAAKDPELETGASDESCRDRLYHLLQQATAEEIQSFICYDYDKDGTEEAFAVTGIYEEADIGMAAGYIGHVWYVDAAGAFVLLEGSVAEEDFAMDFGTQAYYCVVNQYAGASGSMVRLWSVGDGAVYEDISLNGLTNLQAEDGGSYLTSNVSNMIWKEDGTSEYQEGVYYFSWEDGSFYEYGAIPIAREQLLTCVGAEEILSQIDQRGASVQEILYRGNDRIHINYADASGKHSATLALEDGQVSLLAAYTNEYTDTLEQSDYYSFYQSAYTSLAVYPQEFPGGPLTGTEQAEESSGQDMVPQAYMIASGTCGAEGENLVWALYDDGNLVISGNGNMCGYSEHMLNTPATSAPWQEYIEQIYSITVENGVTGIGFFAFTGCSKAQNVLLAESVTRIDRYAFAYCSSLRSINLPSGLTLISEGVFMDCTALQQVLLPQGITVIRPNAFKDCSSLTQITLPQAVLEIGYCAFSGCSSLTEIVIPSQTVCVEKGAFEGCTALAQATIYADQVLLYIDGRDSLLGEGRSFVSNSYLQFCVWPGSTAEQYAVTEGLPYTYISGDHTPQMLPGPETVIDSGICGADQNGEFSDSVTWTLYGDGTMVIAGEGPMRSQYTGADDTLPWAVSSLIRSVRVESGVTWIAAYGFFNCANLTEVRIAETASIGPEAFAGCSENLTLLVVPGSQAEKDAITYGLNYTYQ